MVARVVTTLECDVDSKAVPATRSVTVTVNGKAVNLDLCDKHSSSFDSDMNKWLSKGTAVRKSRQRAKGRTGTTDMSKVRQWANDNGYDVKKTGAVPASVREAYENAHA